MDKDVKKNFIVQQRMNKELDNDNWIYVDIDNTLLIQDQLMEIPDPSRVEMEVFGKKYYLIPHKENIETVKKMHAHGFVCVAWSAAGWKWAKQAIEKLGIQDMFSCVLSKPLYYIDDKDPQVWMGHNLYMDNNDISRKTKEPGSEY